MTKPWIKVLEKVQLFERAHSPNESNTESSGFKINFTECTKKNPEGKEGKEASLFFINHTIVFESIHVPLDRLFFYLHHLHSTRRRNPV